MRRSLSSFKVRTSIFALPVVTAAFIAGLASAYAQSDVGPEPQVVLTQEGSYEISAGSVTRDTANRMELTDGVVVRFEDSDMTLRANTMTIREGEPWEIVGFDLSRSEGTFTADRGTFDPETQVFTTEGHVSLTRR